MFKFPLKFDFQTGEKKFKLTFASSVPRPPAAFLQIKPCLHGAFCRPGLPKDVILGFAFWIRAALKLSNCQCWRLEIPALISSEISASCDSERDEFLRQKSAGISHWLWSNSGNVSSLILTSEMYKICTLVYCIIFIHLNFFFRTRAFIDAEWIIETLRLKMSNSISPS